MDFLEADNVNIRKTLSHILWINETTNFFNSMNWRFHISTIPAKNGQLTFPMGHKFFSLNFKVVLELRLDERLLLFHVNFLPNKNLQRHFPIFVLDRAKIIFQLVNHVSNRFTVFELEATIIGIKDITSLICSLKSQFFILLLEFFVNRARNYLRSVICKEQINFYLLKRVKSEMLLGVVAQG